MTHAIRFHKTGGPEVLVWEEVQVGKPGPGEARIRHTAVGLNFIDIYNRSGLYPVQLPSGIGLEGAGVVEALGAGVTSLKLGDRVATVFPRPLPIWWPRTPPATPPTTAPTPDVWPFSST